MAENAVTDIPTLSTTVNVTNPTIENFSYNKTCPVVKSEIVEILPENDKQYAQKFAEGTNMNVSISIEEEDTSSSDLKWDTMSITSMQSGMTQFDTIEDVSYAIGKNEKDMGYNKIISAANFVLWCTVIHVSIYHYIDACKKAILETIENTDSRKEMVLRLIQLRIRFEDMKERANHASIINNSVETRGHFFVRYSYDNILEAY